MRRPLLLHGFKCDLRLYVVVLSFDPLKIYLNEEGLVRLATEKYSCDPTTLGNQTVHLTNYAVNKKSEAFVDNLDGEGDDEEDEGAAEVVASKWSLQELREHLEAEGVDFDDVLWNIEQVAAAHRDARALVCIYIYIYIYI